MNLLLENACIHWNGIDPEFLSTDFERFWFCFWFKSFSKWFCLRIRWFTTVETRCRPWNPYGFQRFLVFHDFWTKILRIPYGFTSVWIRCYSWVWRGKFFEFHLVLFGDLDLNLQKPFDLILFLLILAGNPEINCDSSSFSSSLVQNLRIRSLFFSNPRLCDRIRVCCFLRRIWCLDCRGQDSMMKIRLNLWELHSLHWFWLELLLENC